MLETVGRAAAMFALTTIDSLVVVTLFLGRVRGDRRAETAVVAGLFAGYFAVVGFAVAGSFGLALLPDRAIRILGVIPLLLGLQQAELARRSWVRRRRERRAQTGSARGAAVAAAEAGGGEDAEVPPAQRRAHTPAGWALAVAGVTVANGSDNVGLYTPAFMGEPAAGLATYLGVFAVLLAAVAAVAGYLARRRVVAAGMRRFGRIALALVLIGVGINLMLGGVLTVE